MNSAIKVKKYTDSLRILWEYWNALNKQKLKTLFVSICLLLIITGGCKWEELTVLFSKFRFLLRCLYLFRLSLIYIHDSKETQNTQPTITCSKLTIETLEQGVKYVQG